MQSLIDIKRNMQKNISFIKQAGVSSLLFIVLVGLSLTVLTVGYMSTMRNLQSSATTTHAQTQAQMQAMIGYHALTKYLKKESLTNIAKIESGVVSGGTEPVKFTKVTCGADQYCFDLVGKSGGASAILRVNYNIVDKLEAKSQSGSVFAGGLRVNKLEDLSAKGITLEVSGGIINKNNNHVYGESELGTAGITVIPYQPKDFIKPEDARKDANYIFYLKNNVAKCAINNIFDSATTPNKRIEIETELGNVGSASCPSNVTYSGSVWIVNGASAGLVGVLWFDGNVVVNLSKDTNFKNTVVATQKIETELLNETKDSLYEAYAPHHFVLTANTTTLKAERLAQICPESYPLQYCVAKGVLKSTTLMQEMPAVMANILFLAQTIELSAGKEKQHNIVANYYGNIMANGASGGTGGASGKFTGTGVLNIRGNLMVVGEADMTNMLGDFSMKLSSADASGNYVPAYTKTFAAGGIRYM
ncbi:MAG: hypothetical protein Q4F77_11525 [Acinetobacter sp.]|uniref:hypothetical protein n=1 Tax=Acinetobacter sp. TaxID=472 RepID=UPI0026DF69CA|nr:hypothetical protein [Acinetobacter sp.]MDO5543919.1 hypothetical protein [Acinetobacter sp.]